MATKKAATLLIELFTEELPPKALEHLSGVFKEGIYSGLNRGGFLSPASTATPYASPRRLAVTITEVMNKAPDRPIREKIVPVAVGLDKDGKLTRALINKLESRKLSHVPFEKLTRGFDGKTEFYFYEDVVPAEPLRGVLELTLERTVETLPIPKVMSYQIQSDTVEFVRPARSLVALHGTDIVAVNVLGLQAGRETRGHRFMGTGKIKIPAADQYEAVLEKRGSVIASFKKRKQRIRTELDKKAAGAKVVFDDALLGEVTALVEWPVVYSGSFDKSFLDLPQECLEFSMKQHQRYFPLADRSGKLLPQFLIVSNLQTGSPENIIHGNERVLRARLADAKFFYDQDRKTRLEARVPRLANVVYHNKLGSQLERTERIQLLAGKIAREIGADPLLAERAAWLSKADLLTNMVGEFPELQGVMGRYYAINDGESEIVANAIEAHYRPRFAGDRLPEGYVACAVALADKLDTTAGLFGIGQMPTGEKDPFGLRRAALGVVRILIERDLSLSLYDLSNAAFAGYGGRVANVHTDLESFIFERLAGYLKDRGYSTLEVASVVDRRQVGINQSLRVIEAVHAFNSLPEAQSLAAANKRVVNILKQAEARGESFANPDESWLQEPAERALFDALNVTSRQADSLLKQRDYTGYLKSFAVLKSPVDAFFDRVMVMVDSPELRHNRLALLANLREKMNRIADISKLVIEK